jgi:heme/copper-type cytochrome/quinol oxidase subunit 2
MADTVSGQPSTNQPQSLTNPPTTTQPTAQPPAREDWAGGLSIAWQCLLLFIFSAIWVITLMFIIMGLTTGPLAPSWSDYVNLWARLWYIPVLIILLATISPIIRDRQLRRQGR